MGNEARVARSEKFTLGAWNRLFSLECHDLSGWLDIRRRAQRGDQHL